MDITVYLPDSLGERAKADGINLSRMLRDAISEEFQMKDAMAGTLDNVQVFEVELEDRNNARYTGRITGAEIARDDDERVFLTDDQRVIIYNGFKLQYSVCEDPENDLRSLNEGAYTEAMHALGLTPTIDL